MQTNSDIKRVKSREREKKRNKEKKNIPVLPNKVNKKFNFTNPLQLQQNIIFPIMNKEVYRFVEFSFNP